MFGLSTTDGGFPSSEDPRDEKLDCRNARELRRKETRPGQAARRRGQLVFALVCCPKSSSCQYSLPRWGAACCAPTTENSMPIIDQDNVIARRKKKLTPEGVTYRATPLLPWLSGGPGPLLGPPATARMPRPLRR